MATNNITGDALRSKSNSKAYADNYEKAFSKVADETDRASDYEEIARSAAIATACTLASEPLPTAKHCFECGAKTNGKRWCNSDCETTDTQRKRFNRGL